MNLKEIDFQDLDPNNPEERKELCNRLERELDIIKQSHGLSSVSRAKMLVGVLKGDN